MLVLCFSQFTGKIWSIFGPVCQDKYFWQFFHLILQLSPGTKTVVRSPVLQVSLFWTRVRFWRLRVLRSLTLVFTDVWLSTLQAQLSCPTVFRFMVSIKNLGETATCTTFALLNLLRSLTVIHHTIILEEIWQGSREHIHSLLLFAVFFP